MKKANKMNGLFKTAFILLMICIPLFALAIVFAAVLENENLSVVFSASGTFIAFLGIIFAMKSKPKKPRVKSIILPENEPEIENNQ